MNFVRRKIKYAVAVAGLIVVIAITVFIAVSIHQNLNTNTKILLNNQYNELFTEDELIQKGHIKTLTGYSSDSSIAFLNDDGSTTLYVYASPIRYLDRKGDSILIDTRLTNITDVIPVTTIVGQVIQKTIGRRKLMKAMLSEYYIAKTLTED